LAHGEERLRKIKGEARQNRTMAMKRAAIGRL
jgi:hypothetical protein